MSRPEPAADRTLVEGAAGGGSLRPAFSAEMVAFVLLAALGAYMTVSSFGLGLRSNGSWVAPGTMPLAIGAPLLAIALVRLVACLRRPSSVDGPAADAAEDDDAGVDIFGRTARQRVHQLWTVVVLLAVAIALVPLIGFALSFGALVFVVSTFVERRRLVVAVAVTAVSLVAVHLVFVMFLGVPLPGGILGVPR